MNTSIALFNGLSRAAGRTIVTGTLRPSRALATGLRRPFSTILGVLPGLSKSSCTEQETKSTESITKTVRASVAAPTLLAVVCLYAIVQRIDLAVQAKDELLSEVSRLQSRRFKPVPGRVPGASRSATPKPSAPAARHCQPSACAPSSAQLAEWSAGP
ncbi:TPA: hypothetical protein ACH3X3_000479 [Trebouxia sp. C0006]